MFGPSAPFCCTSLGEYIYEFGSMSTTRSPSRELTPHFGTYSRIHFPYILPSDIIGCSIGLPSSQTMTVNFPPSPTITHLSTHSAP